MSIFTTNYTYQPHPDGDDDPFDDDFLMQDHNREAAISAKDPSNDISDLSILRRERTRAPDLFKYVDDTMHFQGLAVDDDELFEKMSLDYGTSHELARKYNGGNQADKDRIKQGVNTALDWEGKATNPQRAAQRRAAEKIVDYKTASNGPKFGGGYDDMGNLAPGEVASFFQGTPEARKAIAAPLNAALQPWAGPYEPPVAGPIGGSSLKLANAAGGTGWNADGSSSRAPLTMAEEGDWEPVENASGSQSHQATEDEDTPSQDKKAERQHRADEKMRGLHSVKSSKTLYDERAARRGERPGEVDVDKMSPLGVVQHWVRNDGGKLHFGPDSKMSKEFSESNGAKEFEEYFRTQFRDDPMFFDYAEVVNFGRTFRPGRVIGAANLAEHVVGSFENGTAKLVGDKIVFRVENTMGLNSLFYGQPLRQFTEKYLAEPIEIFGDQPDDLHMTIEWTVPWRETK